MDYSYEKVQNISSYLFLSFAMLQMIGLVYFVITSKIVAGGPFTCTKVYFYMNNLSSVDRFHN